jgi:hypothetical protein
VCTVDGFNYLDPDELRLTLAAVAAAFGPAGGSSSTSTPTR